MAEDKAASQFYCFKCKRTFPLEKEEGKITYADGICGDCLVEDDVRLTREEYIKAFTDRGIPEVCAVYDEDTIAALDEQIDKMLRLGYIKPTEAPALLSEDNMTIDEAIEILTPLTDADTTPLTYGETESIKLGIAALKLVRNNDDAPLLPGETVPNETLDRD